MQISGPVLITGSVSGIGKAPRRRALEAGGKGAFKE